MGSRARVCVCTCSDLSKMESVCVSTRARECVCMYVFVLEHTDVYGHEGEGCVKCVAD